MFKKIFFSIALLATITVKAHQSDVSTTMLVEQENKTWVLQVSASLTAFQQEIRTHFAEYKTPEEFQQMVLQHIKNNLTITFNDDQNIRLSEGRVILGHETKVVFEVFGVPSNIKSVIVKNSAFDDIHKSQSALVLLKEGFDKEHFVLNDENNHTLKLVTDQNKFVLETKNEASFFSYKILFILLGVLALGFISKIIFTKKHQMKNNKLKSALTISALLLCFGAFAQGPQGGGQGGGRGQGGGKGQQQKNKPDALEILSKLDTNNDKVIDKDEASKDKKGKISEYFEDIDTNEDGLIDLEELKASFNDKTPKKVSAEKILKSTDDNNDGTLNELEVAAKDNRELSKNFKDIDINKDGELDLEELKAFYDKNNKSKPKRKEK